MSSPLTASQVLEREYLVIRAKILELAAAFDRIERAEGEGGGDARFQKLQQGVRILLEEQEGRAERVQLHFSREYRESWRKEFGIAATK